MSYGPWLSRDPRLWGSVSQGRWSGNGYSISNFVIVGPGEAGLTIRSQALGVGSSPPAGTYVVEGYITNCEDGSGFQPIVFGTYGPIIDENGPFSVEVEVASPTSNEWGFKATGNGNAQIAAGSAPNDRVDLREVIA